MKKMRGRTFGKRIINNRFRFVLGMIAILGVGSAVADTTTFHTDFDEADLESTGLTIEVSE